MRQKENRPGAGDAYGTVPFNCINDITDMSEFQDLTYNGLLKAVTDDYLDGLDEDAGASSGDQQRNRGIQPRSPRPERPYGSAHQGRVPERESPC